MWNRAKPGEQPVKQEDGRYLYHVSYQYAPVGSNSSFGFGAVDIRLEKPIELSGDLDVVREILQNHLKSQQGRDCTVVLINWNNLPGRSKKSEAGPHWYYFSYTFALSGQTSSFGQGGVTLDLSLPMQTAGDVNEVAAWVADNLMKQYGRKHDVVILNWNYLPGR